VVQADSNRVQTSAIDKKTADRFFCMGFSLLSMLEPIVKNTNNAVYSLAGTRFAAK
jgi:hypothetical protein